jgi:hypothetical protein
VKRRPPELWVDQLSSDGDLYFLVEDWQVKNLLANNKLANYYLPSAPLLPVAMSVVGTIKNLNRPIPLFY